MPNAMTIFTLDHDMLTNVTPNQHHPMLHAEQHGIYGADNVHGYMDLGSFPDSGRLHTDLYGVTPDQHHPQAHAADHAPAGADDVHGYLDLASFPVANREHADLSGIGAEDHQSQFGATGEWVYTIAPSTNEWLSYTNTTWAGLADTWVVFPYIGTITGTTQRVYLRALMQADAGYSNYARVHILDSTSASLGTFGEMSTGSTTPVVVTSGVFTLPTGAVRATLETYVTGGTGQLWAVSLVWAFEII